MIFNLFERAILLFNPTFHSENLSIVTDILRLIPNLYPDAFVKINIKNILKKLFHQPQAKPRDHNTPKINIVFPFNLHINISKLLQPIYNCIIL